MPGPILVSLLVIALIAGCSDEDARGANTSAAGPVAKAEPAEPGAVSEQREVALSVPGMTCLMCPITVRKALEGVDGVYTASATLSDKTAIAAFDPSRTDVDQLIAAIAESGFEATLMEVDDE